jgi:ankyrin repeat protein
MRNKCSHLLRSEVNNMNLPNIHPNLPFIHRQSTPIPFLIQLCISPDEDYAYRTMGRLLSSSLNVCDEFGCNVPMYSLRYQRYRLFKFLLNEKSFDLNLWAKDRQGNSILHYAILYSGNDTEIMEKLIEKYNKFARDIDERNNFGFSPLLLGEMIMNVNGISMNYLYF